ncbi:MAG: dephospho-CoA kinase [bacterium]
MLVIGITGIIGSGKSLAVEYLAEKGYVVYDMDSKAKELMAMDDNIKQKIRKAFGEESFTPDGTPNTEFISQAVFGQHNSKKLDLLNSIVHPAVIDDMIAFTESEMDNGTDVVFLESALILESGLDEGCDYIINIDSTKEICLERVMARSGLTEAQVLERMNSQFSPEQKRQFADFTINNNSTKKDFFSALELILDIVLSLPEKDFENTEE